MDKKNQKKTGNKNLDDLIRKLLVYNPKNRIEWNSYFSHPFFDFSAYIEGTIECKVVLVGESGVGKTSIISRYIKNIFKSELSTIGTFFSTKKMIMEEEKKVIKFKIWDTAGQEKYRSITKNFYQNSDVIIFVYDITEKLTFEELKNFWIKEIKKYLPENISKKNKIFINFFSSCFGWK